MSRYRGRAGNRRLWLVAAALLFSWGCATDPADDLDPDDGGLPPVIAVDPNATAVERPVGATDFVSADGQSGQETQENSSPTAGGDAAEDFSNDGD
ncbi:MAG: hypothetical protein KC561_04800, partial [Myxococcales bacterium]|nr:hypothetical protein [Myxococcales bacterium]